MRRSLTLQRSYLYLIIQLVLLIATGCSGVASETGVATNPSMTTSTPILQIFTATPGPTQVIPTPTVTSPTPTLEPVVTELPSTLTAQEAKALILDLLPENGGCELPCFWNWSPGKTNSQILQSFIVRLGKTIEPGDIIVGPYNFDDKGGITSINLHRKNTRISIGLTYDGSQEKLDNLAANIQVFHEEGTGADLTSKAAFGDPVFSQLFEYYLLPQVLLNYSKPSRVLIKPILYGAPYLVDDLFSLVLDYSPQGFYIEYIFPLTVDGDKFLGCPSETGYLNIVTWNPEKQLTLSDFVQNTSGVGLNELTVGEFKPLEEATSMTLDEFYQLFTKPNKTNCLKTSANLWTP